MTKFASRLSRWFAPDDGEAIRQSELRAGATFARLTETQITETARILCVAKDDGGIVHVRYASRLHRANRTLDRGQRTLALLSFLSRFERVAAHREQRLS